MANFQRLNPTWDKYEAARGEGKDITDRYDGLIDAYKRTIKTKESVGKYDRARRVKESRAKKLDPVEREDDE